MEYICPFSEFKGRNLEKDVVSETSGHFRRLLVAQCNASRDENPVVDMAKAEKDAKDIWEVIFFLLAFVLDFLPSDHAKLCSEAGTFLYIVSEFVLHIV